MPYIPPQDRLRIQIEGCSRCVTVGDLCYVFYKRIMEVWRTEPRWTTNHRIYRDFSYAPEGNGYWEFVYEQVKCKFEKADVICASKLAYKMFWDRHIYDYEIAQMEKNGDI